MQNDFFHDDGWFSLLGVDVSPLHKAVDSINRLLPTMRASDTPIVWLNWGYSQTVLTCPQFVQRT